MTSTNCICVLLVRDRVLGTHPHEPGDHEDVTGLAADLQNTSFTSDGGTWRSQYEYSSVRLSSAFCGMFCNGTIQVLRSPVAHDGLAGGCCGLPAVEFSVY
jgi:hypothetical protein